MVATPADLPKIERRLAAMLGSPRLSHRTLDPLEELILTVISQQTAHENSRRAYAALRDRFPTWEALRDAEALEIAAAIQSAGLARLKAPRIKAILNTIWEQRGSFSLDFLAELSVEEALSWLRRLPGVGQTTAACVLLFGLHVPAMPVDTGILRVSRRLGFTLPNAGADHVARALQDAVPPARVYRFHVNLIHFSRDVCQAQSPHCAVCPLNDLCTYFHAAHVRVLRASPGSRVRSPESVDESTLDCGPGTADLA